VLSLLLWRLDDFSVASRHTFALLARLEALCQDYSLFRGQMWTTGEGEGFLASCKTGHVCTVLVTCFNLREGWGAAARDISAQTLPHWNCGGDVVEHKPLSRELHRYDPRYSTDPPVLLAHLLCDQVRKKKSKLRSTYKRHAFPPKPTLLDWIPFTSTLKPLNCLAGGAWVQLPLDSSFLCACVLDQFSLFLSFISSFM